MLGFTANAQTLKPGFDADEYLDMLSITTQQGDYDMGEKIPRTADYHMAYRSAVVGLSNRWYLWVNTANNTMVINLRGTIGSQDSWLENFYAAMIPAEGTLHLSDTSIIHYKFAADPKAAIHAGWALGVCSMIPSIIKQIKSFYGSGIKQVIIMGHSQGGAMAYLLRSYLYYQMQEGKLPSDLTIKTYCSAAPKPGNLYYAYDYDFINRGGWSMTVVNAADWVPETPFSLQNIDDMNVLNPFTNAKEILRAQKLFLRLYGGHVYGQLTHPAKRLRHRYKKYLGHVVYTQVKKYMPQYQEPVFANTSNYMRAGTPVVLEPDAEYYKQFSDTSSNVFEHHLFEPYYYLVKKYYKTDKY